MKRMPFTAALVATGVAGGAVASLTAHGDAPGSTRAEPLARAAQADFTVKTTIRAGDETFVDRRPRGPSQADEVTGLGRITGDKSGRFEFTCTLVTETTSLCDGAARFRDGVVFRTARIVGNPRVLTIAITGGTGDYEGASGVIVSERVGASRAPGRTRDRYQFE